LACASHQVAALHTGLVGKWLETMGLTDNDFRCGAAEPSDLEARNELIRAPEHPCQIHHEC
jgi:L-asparaginase II